MATHPKNSRRPPPRYPTPTTPEEILMDIHRRTVRIETRLGRCMENFGLDSEGNPAPVQAVPIAAAR